MYQKRVFGSWGLNPSVLLCVLSSSLNAKFPHSFSELTFVSAIPVESRNSAQDSKAIVGCQIKVINNYWECVHATSHLPLLGRWRSCTAMETKAQVRLSSQRCGFEFELTSQFSSTCFRWVSRPKDYLHPGIIGPIQGRELLPARGPQHLFISEDKKWELDISGGFQFQKHEHKPGMFCYLGEQNSNLGRYFESCWSNCLQYILYFLKLNEDLKFKKETIT